MVPARWRERRPERRDQAHGLGQAGRVALETAAVPSGVRSRGPNPVPPVVTTTPANPAVSSRSTARDAVDAVGDDPALDDSNPAAVEDLDGDVAGPVLPGAGDDPVGHGDDLGCGPRAHRTTVRGVVRDPIRWSGGPVQRARNMPSVPAVWGRRRAPLPQAPTARRRRLDRLEGGVAATSGPSAAVSVHTE